VLRGKNRSEIMRMMMRVMTTTTASGRPITYQCQHIHPMAFGRKQYPIHSIDFAMNRPVDT
jgi:hypothetical protein